jgi:ankyrin repeat protein
MDTPGMPKPYQRHSRWFKALLLLFSALWVVRWIGQAHVNAQCYWAVIANDTPQVGLLLDLGANPNMTDVTTAPRWGLREEWEWWRDKLTGQLTPSRPVDTKYTLLMRAVQYADGEMVALLVEKGADVHAQDCAGRTAMDWAIEDNRQEAIAVLKQAMQTQ